MEIQKTNTRKSHTLPLPGIASGVVWPKLPDAKAITRELPPRDGSKPLLFRRSRRAHRGWASTACPISHRTLGANSPASQPHPREEEACKGLFLKLGSGCPAHQHL